MDYNTASLALHEQRVGKIEVVSKVAIETRDDLSLAYTPGVAQPCREIRDDKEAAYRYTAKGNLVAVVTDGTAVLGLGDIGPEAALPVMEGKAILFKEFGNVDAFPLCLSSTDVDEIVQSVIMIAPTFGGINLEDISAPRCVEIEERLNAALDIPVFHDDQHGTAIVVASAMINALKVVGKEISNIRVVVNGAGAAGGAIIKMLLALGVTDILACDKDGILCEGGGNLPHLEVLACKTNRGKRTGILADAMVGADVFVGVSAGNIVSKAMVASMNANAVVFAMANPTPEIMPDDARAAGAAVVGSGRSDFPNQVNNVLAFPGIFRGALDARAHEINSAMCLAAAYAIAGLISDDEVSAEYVIPDALDRRVGTRVADAVAKAAVESGATERH